MIRVFASLAALALLATPALADTAHATCEVVPNGQSKPISRGDCVFYQAQGHVVITLADGQEFDLMPTEGYGTYVDAEGRPAQRTDELGSEGSAYQLQDVTVYVYW